MGLVEIAAESAGKRSVERVVSALACDIVDVLDVDLVTVWLLEPTLKSMTCICSRDTENKRQLEGVELQRKDYPTYFAKILEDIGIISEDVYQDPRLFELVDSYFKPNGVKSLLDFLIFDEGKPKAIICCETTKDHRAWSDSDVAQIRKHTVLSSSLAKWH